MPPVEVPIPLPVRGLYRGSAHAQRPEGTTDRATNVRNVPPVSGRLGYGKRAGLAKALTTQAGSIKAANTRINHIATMQEAADTPASAEGAFVNVVETFSAVTVANPANLGTDLAAFTKTLSGGFVQNYYDFQVTQSSPGSATYPCLSVDWYRQTGDPALGYPGVAVLYPCAGPVSIKMWADGNTASPADNGGAGNANECTGFGPFIRGSSDLDYFVGACLLASGSDEVKLSIVEVNGTTRTTLAQSAAITLDSGAGTGAGGAPPLKLTISATATQITARVEWTNPGTGGPAATTDISVTVANSTNATYTRAGCAALFTNTGTSLVDDRWPIAEIAYTKLVPESPTVLIDARRGADDAEEDQFYLPDGLEAVRLAAGAPYTVGATFSDSDSSQPTTPHIDQANNRWYASGTVGDTEYVTTTAAQAAGTIVEVKGHEALAGTYTDNDIMGAALRVSSDRLTCLLVKFWHTGTSQYGTAEQDHLQAISFVAFNAGTLTTLQTFTYDGGGGTTQAHMPVVNRGTRIEIKDSGGAASAMTVTVSFNGIIWRTFTPSTMTNWTAPIAAALSDTGRVGASVTGSGGSAAPATFESYGFRIISRSSSTAARVAESESRVAVFTTGRVYTGNLQDDALEVTEGFGPLNPVVATAVIGRKWYAVDGGGIWVIDPAEITCTALAATEGVLPENPRLCCAYRRRLVVARFDSDPTLWACSRTAVPADWDYAADPVETAAVIGNSGVVGTPADPITALIPYQNDLLLFGCPGSIYQLVGDPGYGGRLERLTSETGVVGPRAWVFDGRDVLWFIGNAGLMRWSPGMTEPEPVSAGRIPALSELDATAYFVQMGYDPWDQTVTVYLTPVDGTTAGTHIVYHVPTDAFVSEDQYQPDHGPWAVAQPYGSKASDRRALLGGNDGYVRRLVEGTNGDDGSAITAEIEIPIPDISSGMRHYITKAIMAWGSSGSGSVTWRWFTGTSPEAVASQANGSAVASGTWFATDAGFQSPQTVRRSGASQVVRVTQSSASLTFGLERLAMSLEGRGRRR